MEQFYRHEVELPRGQQRFELQDLEQGVTYPVSLVAFKGNQRSQTVSTTLSTVDARFPHPSDCSQVQQNTNAASGLYTIYLNGDASRPMQVYCDMDTDGGGWIVFQRRNTGQLDFFKRWRSYVEGFGDPMKEFWLGLDKLHNLTTGTTTRYEVRADLQTFNESAYAVYDFFQVASSKERYKLSPAGAGGQRGESGSDRGFSSHQSRLPLLTRLESSTGSIGSVVKAGKEIAKPLWTSSESGVQMSLKKLGLNP